MRNPGYSQSNFFPFVSSFSSTSDGNDDHSEHRNKDSDTNPNSNDNATESTSLTDSEKFEEVEADRPDGKDNAFDETHNSSSSPPPALSNAVSSLFGRTTPQRTALKEITTVPVLPIFHRPSFPGVLVPIVVQDVAIADEFIALKALGPVMAGLFLHKKVGMQSFVLNEDNEQSANLQERQDSSASSAQPESLESQTFASALHRVGVLAELIKIVPRAKNSVELIFWCHQRIRWLRVVPSTKLLKFEVEPLVEERVDMQGQQIRAYSLAIVETLKQLLEHGTMYKQQVELLLHAVDIYNPYQLADLGACLTTADPQKVQEVLEELDLEKRLAKTLSLLVSELETIRVQRKINKQIEENLGKAQRKFFLTEELKTIKKELGLEKDEKETVVNKFQNRLKDKTVPEAAQRVIDEELTKISTLDPSSSEYSVTRNYLDWLTALPWGIHTTDILQISRAESILNRDHYAMDDVKKRILEFVAVAHLRGANQGKILLLSGPPGVGKTSIGKSIASALDRKFYRFSVGGLSDVAEIKGHRRTYIGAMPGKFIQALKMTGSSNPVIMIDEIDKLGRGYQGDPASALLEALDPEQNANFMDHYLDTPVDLSHVLFIATANVLDTIPPPLLDRMDNIRLPGYVLDEKVKIASRYLIPNARTECGLSGSQVVFRTSALQLLAQKYCREAGVRNLKQQIEKILRKVALLLVRNEQAKSLKQSGSSTSVSSMNETESSLSNQRLSDLHKPTALEAAVKNGTAIVVTENNLSEFIGRPQIGDDRIYETTPPGVATGLAWTSAGGATLYIETVSVAEIDGEDTADSHEKVSPRSSGTRGFKATGQMGDVMKESVDIAYSFAVRYLKRTDKTNTFFERNSIHIHIPEGATPKDGPSAGVTIITALLSLALDKPVSADIGMTGEVTLTGKVLSVGGIREKMVAAQRSGLKTVILPESNRKDWEELPDFVQANITAHFVSQYEQLLSVVFEN
eukprot:CAMPEP_0182442710 /NCGR_PEP_ID=MMETSP1172-20130603/1620_1 /TAXON_ID=708627 /ORGANISM="Timspurckia oligopyrenoides, Strain CCMP3278" /LENGTH=974 /DNA_ID=CAMNT_0024637727 /DNA_START=148 /DNA_END=3072 /DNA_ORIENTATION=+